MRPEPDDERTVLIRVNRRRLLPCTFRRSSLWLVLFAAGCQDAYVLFPDGGERDSEQPGLEASFEEHPGPTRPGSHLIVGTEAGQRVGGGALVVLPADQTPNRVAELLVGAPDDPLPGREAGSLALHHVSWAAEARYDDADAALFGSAGARFGCAAHPLLDIGVVAIGACARSAEGGERLGAVYLFDHGTISSGGQAWEVASGRIEGASEDGLLGSSLTSGDLNGDGALDLVVSAPHADGGRGRLYLVDDIVAQPWRTVADIAPIARGSAGEDHFGASLLMGGDLTGDGHDDLVACAPGWDVAGAPGAGACAVIAGGLPVMLGDDLEDAVVSVIYGNTPGDATGDGHGSIAVGPFLSQGRTGIAIGLPGAKDGNGSVILVGGDDLDGHVSSSAATIRIDGKGEFGSSLANLPGGGLLVGAPGFSSGGAAFGILAADIRMPGGEAAQAEDVADANWLGLQPHARFGHTVTSNGDLDGDQWPDIVVGAPFLSTDDGGQVGQVVVTALPSGWPLETPTGF